MINIAASLPHRYIVGQRVRIKDLTLLSFDGKEGIVIRLTRANAESYPAYLVEVTMPSGRRIPLGPLTESEVEAVPCSA